MKEPKLNIEMGWSIFKCMFVITLVLIALLGGLFAYYIHNSFKGTSISASMNQIENNNSIQGITNG